MLLSRCPRILFLLPLLLVLLVPQADARAPQGDGKRDDYEKIYDATIKGRSLEAYVQEINSGWGPNIARLRPHLKQDRSYLVLHVIEPRPVYDLRSADAMRLSLLSTKGLVRLLADPTAIGHVFVSWRCDVGGRMVEGTTGITGEYNRQAFKLFMAGYGMGAFFSQYTDGHLQTPKLLDLEFKSAEVMHNLAVEVDGDVCGNAMGFVSDFIHHEKRPYTLFGPDFDPTKFEGGGCGSFGISVLEKSGFFGQQPMWPLLWRTIRVNPRVFGYGLEAPADTIAFQLEKTGSRKVSILGMMRRNWDKDAEKGPSIRQQDPEMLLLFLKALYRHNMPGIRGTQADAFANSAEYRLRSFGINFRRHTIDSSFDRNSALVVRNTREWMESLKASGYKARLGKIGTPEKPFTAMILDR